MRTGIRSLVFCFLLLPLAGCTITQEPSPKREADEVVELVEVPSLAVDTRVAYRISGVPHGLFNGASTLVTTDSGRAALPADEGRLDIHVTESRIVMPSGGLGQAFKFTYDGNQTGDPFRLETEYATRHGGLVLRESLTRAASESGQQEVVRGAAWKAGTTDLMGALLWSEQKLAPSMETPIHTTVFAGLEDLARPLWRVDGNQTKTTATLASADHLAFRGWSRYAAELDTTCAFPSEIKVERDGHPIFQATRISCVPGEGDALSIAGPAPQVVQPSSFLIPVGTALDLTDWAPAGEFSLHEGYRILMDSPEYDARCDAGCRWIGYQWAQGEREQSSFLDLGTGESREVLQWGHSFVRDGKVVSFLVEQEEASSVSVAEIEPLMEAPSGGDLLGIDLGQATGLGMLIGTGNITSWWRLASAEGASPADAYVSIFRGNYLIGEDQTIAGHPLRFPVLNAGRLDRWSFASFWEV